MISIGGFETPPGMSFDNGVLSGTPAVSGVYTLHVVASNGVGADATQTFTLFVNPLPTVYVSGTFSGMAPGRFVADADLGVAGDQPAIFGTSAFATIADALAAVNGSGTVIVNAGTYAESPQITGATTLQLTGNVTVNSIDSDSTANIDLQTYTLTTGDAAGNNTLASPIVGLGSLVKVGSDTLTLGGADFYAGPTTVSAGSLLVNGSLSSAVSVATGATLGGTGIVGDVSSPATNSGIINPGTSTTDGTLTVGSFVLGSGTLTLNLDGLTHYDSVKVTGSTIDLTNTNLTRSRSLPPTSTPAKSTRSCRIRTTGRSPAPSSEPPKIRRSPSAASRSRSPTRAATAAPMSS